MTITTRFNLKDKVMCIVKGTGSNFTIKETYVADIRLIVSTTTPTIVYKVQGSSQEYLEFQLYADRKELERALVERAISVANSKHELHLGVFLEVFNRYDEE